MDLKNFQSSQVLGDETNKILSQEDHDNADKILQELEERLRILDNEEIQKKISGEDLSAKDLVLPGAVSESVETSEEVSAATALATKSIMDSADKLQEETQVLVSPKEDTFADKVKPFILPIFLTIFALIFASIFMFIFSKSRIQQTVPTIQNQNNQPEVIIIKEKEPVEIPAILEPVATKTEPVVEKPPEKPKFENGTTTVMRLRFSFDQVNLDNHPRGIYLLEIQHFDGEYEDYKLIASNRSFANDFFFGIDRNKVSLIGSCRYVVDEAEVLVANIQEGEKTLKNIDKRYFTGTVKKVLSADRPRIDCSK